MEVVEGRKRDRLYVRLANAEAQVIKAGAARLDCSISELVRQAAIRAALRALGMPEVAGR